MNFIKYIDTLEALVIELQTELTKRPAINPENGGDGEYEKFLFLKNYLNTWGFDSLEEILAPDLRVSAKVRPSLIASMKGGSDSKTLWLITHLDVVPPGELNLWNSDPYKVIVRNGKVYGRGVEDNQQSLVSSLLAAKALLELKIKPKYNVKLLFVADEEVGSEYGIKWILENTNIFSKDDFIITPDVGDKNGSIIEVAEKSILWVGFKIYGRQSHGSRPDLGINTARASSHLCVRMEKLNGIYNAEDAAFDIPYSTFEPTKRGNAITNFNTIPGEEYLGFDCRILPRYKLTEVLENIKKITGGIETDFGVKIETEIHQDVQAPLPTPADSDVVKLLKGSIKKILGIDAKPVGIGGGTVAAYFRMRGINAALWSTNDNTMHAPNECSSIKNTLNDAKVFADIMINNSY